MRRIILLTISLTLAAQAVSAATFEKTPIAPDQGLDALTRGVSRQQVGRDLFSDPYSTVTIGNVDVYAVFPYVEARTFQVVSDPRWNRLVYGEPGKSLKAFDGAGTALGALSDPRGLSVDEQNHVYVADAGNNRVVVLEASTEFDDMTLVPLYAIDGLNDPYDVAYSDGGTPFVSGDDFLYVADTGRNRVVAFALDGSGARKVAEIGQLGSGPGRFAGPMAITVGRSGGANTRDVYVADAHTRRIVHLQHAPTGLRWVAEAQHDVDVLTSLDTDQWGNLYAAAPNRGVVRKFNPALSTVAELRGDLARPRSFHLPYLNVRDHRDGRAQRVGQPKGISVEQWSDQSGLRLWNLGVDVSGLSVAAGPAPAAQFTLTDQAQVTMDIVAASSGRLLSSRSVGALGAGIHMVPLVDQDLRAAAGSGDLVLRVSAASSYPNGGSAVAQTGFHLDGSAAVLPSQPMLLGNTPNPFSPMTRIAFVLPAGKSDDVSLRVFDASGRVVRTFSQGFAPGLNQVVWNGTDEHGAHVPAGVYFYRLHVGAQGFTQKMVVLR